MDLSAFGATTSLTRRFSLLLGGLCWVGAMLACTRSQPQVIVITSSPEPSAPVVQPTPNAAAEEPVPQPTADPTRDIPAASLAGEYVVQAGDTLGVIASQFGISVEALAELNGIDNPNLIEVGQVLQLPSPPPDTTPDFKILPDSRLVRGPGSPAFDVEAFVSQQPGLISSTTDIVEQRRADGSINRQLLTGAQIVQRVSLEFSVDPRVLLAMLEYRGGWLSQPVLSDEQVVYALGEVDPSRSGLYKQLAWAANVLNAGYYGWRYRDLTVLQLGDGARLSIAPGLNAGTVGVQLFLGQNTAFDVWERDVSQGGFFETYRVYFGNPFESSVDPLVPAGLAQPALTLPFPPEQVWFFTGGPHGGWGGGSAWAAIDFAPPDEREAGQPACYTSQFPVTAIAPGVIARSEQGSVVLDLDGDGDEATGWSVLYLHIAATGRVSAGTQLQPGDTIGFAACEGGFSNATHMHIARRYNGEWLPTDCVDCGIPPFVMSDWRVSRIPNQEYQGFLLRGGEQRQAEQGRLTPINRVSW